MNTVIVIPIYKQSPDEIESASFVRCFHILKKYPIRLITYKSFNVSNYQRLVDAPLEIIYFDKTFFESISGYNSLLKQHKFYLEFKQYDYMLIYQLDAWVFNDSLSEWCNKGYDYIGAPWFEDFGDQANGKKLWKVGNGGFSLRRISKFLKVTRPYLHYETTREIITHDYHGLKSMFFCVAKMLGYHNTVGYYKKKHITVNEDYYFTVNSEAYANIRLSVPDVFEAASFSMERSPRYLYNKIGALPLGCHAFIKNEWDFWKQFIPISKQQ